jgi:CheY-like chemotaxis protein
MIEAELKRVLVVDDDEDVRRMLTTVLERAAIVVDTARDGHEAMEFAREHRYSVILLDLLMPVADGFYVLAEMQSQPLDSPPVVLVVTGAERSVIDQLDPQRIHGIIRKPFDPEEVASVVVACADIKSRSSYGTMAIATMMAGGPILALLNRIGSS